MYIEEQEEHHKKRTFEEELILFLKEYEIDFDQRHLFTDWFALSGRIMNFIIQLTQGVALGWIDKGFQPFDQKVSQGHSQVE